MSFQRRSSSTALAGLLACILGCSRAETLGPVSGRVTFHGNSVSPGLIIFANRKKGVYITAKLGADGTYKVVTAKGAGLPLGSYQVAVTTPLPEETLGPIRPESMMKMSFPNIPQQYRKIETSQLNVELREGDNLFNVDMQSSH